MAIAALDTVNKPVVAAPTINAATIGLDIDESPPSGPDLSIATGIGIFVTVAPGSSLAFVTRRWPSPMSRIVGRIRIIAGENANAFVNDGVRASAQPA